jgi:SufE protein probably involved in Fe-S center assembly
MINQQVILDEKVRKLLGEKLLPFDKYAGILELSTALPPVPNGKNGIMLSNCQNSAEVYSVILNDKTVCFYGNSDSRLIKGMMAILFSCINIENNIYIERPYIDSIFKELDVKKYYDESIPMGLGLVIDEVLRILRSCTHAETTVA